MGCGMSLGLMVFPLALAFAEPLPALEFQKTRAAVDGGEVELRSMRMPAGRIAGAALVPIPKDALPVKASELRTQANQIVVNTVFFDGQKKPVGFLKIGGEVRNATRSRRLSGFVGVDGARIELAFQRIEEEKYANVFQAGPCLIELEGKPGIRADDGRKADRIAVAKTKDGDVLLICADSVSLFTFSQAIQTAHPDVDIAINLDGGPSRAFASERTTLDNKGYVPLFLRIEVK